MGGNIKVILPEAIRGVAKERKEHHRRGGGGGRGEVPPHKGILLAGILCVGIWDSLGCSCEDAWKVCPYANELSSCGDDGDRRGNLTGGRRAKEAPPTGR